MRKWTNKAKIAIAVKIHLIFRACLVSASSSLPKGRILLLSPMKIPMMNIIWVVINTIHPEILQAKFAGSAVMACTIATMDPIAEALRCKI